MRFGVPFRIRHGVFGATEPRTDQHQGNGRHSQPVLRLPLPLRAPQHIDAADHRLGRGPARQRLTPTAGKYQRVNLEWSVAGDVKYLRAISNTSSSS